MYNFVKRHQELDYNFLFLIVYYINGHLIYWI